MGAFIENRSFAVIPLPKIIIHGYLWQNWGFGHGVCVTDLFYLPTLSKIYFPEIDTLPRNLSSLHEFTTSSQVISMAQARCYGDFSPCPSDCVHDASSR
ncbi:hypothetical protein BDP27DRAFT_1329720 [Rhodocollybia butyracea]|uniref:Uncharacterized protein n=1 Tax=Rhodocollybia butyracea TaxID=206335 RepID=A0A9P5PJK7_9AGAR|nr:hypothetical protein BDP27DRAFT_1329720 [Rhodocollybia butyracea]